MKQKWIAAVLCVGLLLSGCRYGQSGIESLLHPPERTEEQREIITALENSIKSDWKLKYPQRGGETSAVILKNLDEDPTKEALVFYAPRSQTESGIALRMNVLDQVNGQWVSMHDIGAGTAITEVEQVLFLTVSHQIYLIAGFATPTEKAVVIYVYNENRLEEKWRMECRDYVLADLNDDGVEEILTLHRATEEEGPTAALYQMTSYGTARLLSTAKTDREANGYASITVGRWNPESRQLAVYLNGIYPGGNNRPEILVYLDRKLQNLMYDGEHERYLRIYESWNFDTPCRDMDSDGIIEIPVPLMAPGEEQKEYYAQKYYTEWYRYNDGRLALHAASFELPGKGYYFILPAGWSEHVGVDYLTETEELVFYELNAAREPENRILSIRMVRRQSDSGEAGKEYALLKDNGQYLYYYRIYSESREVRIKPEQVTRCFRLYA